MNGNIVNLINEIANKYNLMPNEINELSRRFLNDNRNIELVQRDIENMGNYYFYQHKITYQMIFS